MNKVVQELFSKQNLKYQKFNINTIKGNSPIIGVKIPELRNMARQIQQNDLEGFFSEYEGVYFEEKLIKGIIIASEESLFLKYGEDYIQKIDSWCLCDTFCNTAKFIKSDLDKYFPFILKMLDSKQEFVIRTGYVLLLNYYLVPFYMNNIFKLVQREYNFYYVNMAIAWLICELYIKEPQKTIELLKGNINDFVKNKAVEKINDSFRVSIEEKNFLKQEFNLLK